jgi:hypothetical protein
MLNSIDVYSLLDSIMEERKKEYEEKKKFLISFKQLSNFWVENSFRNVKDGELRIKLITVHVENFFLRLQLKVTLHNYHGVKSDSEANFS